GRPLPWGPMTCESFTGFAGILGLAGAVACVARAAITRNWRDRTLSFAAVALIAFSVVANWPIFTKPIHALLPYVAHGRLRLLLCFCGAMFTAALIDMVGQRAAVLIGVCVAAASLGWLLLGWSYSDNATWFASTIRWPMLATRPSWSGPSRDTTRRTTTRSGTTPIRRCSMC